MGAVCDALTKSPFRDFSTIGRETSSGSGSESGTTASRDALHRWRTRSIFYFSCSSSETCSSSENVGFWTTNDSSREG